MKKKVLIPIIVAVTVLVVVLVVVLRNRKYKKYEPTDTAKDFLQIYRMSESESGDHLEANEYMYATGIDSVRVDPAASVIAWGTMNGVDGIWQYYPIKQVIYKTGKKQSYSPSKDYILADSIKQ